MGKGIQGHVGITGMTGMTEMRELERPEQKRSKANGIFPMVQHDIQQQQQQQAVMTPERENHHGLPLVIALNCLEDCRLEVEALSGVAEFRHVGLTQVTEGKIETAMAVLLHSLAYLPCAAQRRLQPWQLILCLSCVDKAVDTALAAELGLQLVHVDSKRVEEVADTTLALILGLLRHTHVLAKKSYASSAGWLGTSHSACKGMHRCKGMVVGIVGTSATACAVAVRSLAFRMVVIYFDPEVISHILDVKIVKFRRDTEASFVCAGVIFYSFLVRKGLLWCSNELVSHAACRYIYLISNVIISLYSELPWNITSN